MSIHSIKHHLSFLPSLPPTLHSLPTKQLPTINMRFSILAFIAGAAAAPFASTGTEPVCPDGLYNSPQCCATDVLGVVGLNCAVRKSLPSIPPLTHEIMLTLPSSRHHSHQHHWLHRRLRCRWQPSQVLHHPRCRPGCFVPGR